MKVLKINSRKEEIEIGVDPEKFIRYQAKYILHLNSMTDYLDYHIEKMIEIFMTWGMYKSKNIMTFRDKQFKSVFTGIIGKDVKKTWLLEKNESMENFV